jgi:hypothetical protein
VRQVQVGFPASGVLDLLAVQDVALSAMVLTFTHGNCLVRVFAPVDEFSATGFTRWKGQALALLLFVFPSTFFF